MVSGETVGAVEAEVEEVERFQKRRSIEIVAAFSTATDFQNLPTCTFP
jgi:hypothetical protein